MDKKLILAVAGSGKTTHIVNSLDKTTRTLILTYTNANYDNLLNKIEKKFHGEIPENIKVFKYFSFLYRFCYKPFLADIVKETGIIYKNPGYQKGIGKKNLAYYLNSKRKLYSNRISLLIQESHVLDDVIRRIEKYFDYFIIDEVQDIAGNDFNLLINLLECNVKMLLVGDFYQHTFDTSTDGQTNKNLYNDFSKYKKRFSDKGITIDEKTLKNSWRCNTSICNFIEKNLKIPINSNLDNLTKNGELTFIEDESLIKELKDNENIIKLNYQNAYKYGNDHKNWGETKGEDCYEDVCVLLNKTTMNFFKKNDFTELSYKTKSKLYVAITRAHRNCYLIEEDLFNKL